MATAEPRHFDYLAEHASDLERTLGIDNLAKGVAHWRRFGMEYPDAPLVGCRKMLEVALTSLVKPRPGDRIRLNDLIDLAEDEDVIDHVMALKCHEIRRKGNLGAHTMSVKAVDAKASLDLFDDFLRWCAEELELIPARSKTDPCASDPIFISKSDEEVEEMSRKARIAGAFEDGKDMRRKAKEAQSEIDSVDDSCRSDLERMEELIRQAEQIGLSATAKGDVAALEAQRTLFERLEAKVGELNADRRVAEAHFDEVSTEIERILNEHDFIRMLLRDRGRATVDQHDVMSFPRGSHSTTNVLQIAGGAGTGKTLCLLAKLIAETDRSGQMALSGTPERKALFICFNKKLAEYVRGILAGYDEAKVDIDVVSYDEYVNQLVRKRPKKGFEYLAPYCQEARYATETIAYGTSEDYITCLRQAQDSVAQRYPNRRRDYFLDPTDQDGFEWLRDELQWIEARFSSDEEAARRYPTAERVGRGKNCLPREAARRIILEIRTEFNRLLDEHGHYTIEQATNRLLGASYLPAYDAIAIDEVQDFSLHSVRLILRFRQDDSSKVFLAGDENQKIYRRDFTWKELDSGVRGYTITLHANMRNTLSIQSFAERLVGVDSPHDAVTDKIHVVNADETRTVKLLGTLASIPRQTTALITGDVRAWEQRLRAKGIPMTRTLSSGSSSPGIHLLGEYMGKGLEFDNVVVDYVRSASDDPDEERRIRYVHFTRARMRLYVRYQDTPPEVLKEYYDDFLW